MRSLIKHTSPSTKWSRKMDLIVIVTVVKNPVNQWIVTWKNLWNYSGLMEQALPKLQNLQSQLYDLEKRERYFIQKKREKGDPRDKRKLKRSTSKYTFSIHSIIFVVRINAFCLASSNHKFFPHENPDMEIINGVKHTLLQSWKLLIFPSGC